MKVLEPAYQRLEKTLKNTVAYNIPPRSAEKYKNASLLPATLDNIGNSGASETLRRMRQAENDKCLEKEISQLVSGMDLLGMSN